MSPIHEMMVKQKGDDEDAHGDDHAETGADLEIEKSKISALEIKDQLSLRHATRLSKTIKIYGG